MAFDPKFNNGDACEGRYAKGIKRNMMIQAGKGRRKKFLALPNAQRVWDFMFETGDFQTKYYDEYDNELVGDEENYYDLIDRREPHPTYKTVWWNDFLRAMKDNLEQWDNLTEKQIAAVIKMIDRADEVKAEREIEAEAERERSDHVGVVGKRQRFELDIEVCVKYEGNFGTTWINIMRDADDNKIVFMGARKMASCEVQTEAGFVDWIQCTKVSFDAMVKEHGERDGVKQTILQRPTKIEWPEEGRAKEAV